MNTRRIGSRSSTRKTLNALDFWAISAVERIRFRRELRLIVERAGKFAPDVDKTKAIAHPTDSHLLLRAIEWLNRLARKQGVLVRQSYLRVARHARREVGRLMHAGQRKQAERWVRKLSRAG